MSERVESESSANRILVVLAHPDDPEFYCGGSVARWISEGGEVIYCLLTRGDKGNDSVGIDPKELSRLRVKEQRAAASVLGVQEIVFLDRPDGYLIPDLTLRRDVVRVIRQVRPEIVVTCDPTNYYPSSRYINHPDHRAAGQVTLDAVFPAAGSGLFFPDLNQKEGLIPHKVNHVYVAGAVRPNMIVDVTDFFDLKVAALKKHASQILDMETLEERLRERMLDPESPSDQPRYIERFMHIDLRR